LVPDGWPGAALRQSYAQFAAELVARRNESELMELT
jgi:phenylacetic acid degradation operon negative regulatory protein